MGFDIGMRAAGPTTKKEAAPQSYRFRAILLKWRRQVQHAEQVLALFRDRVYSFNPLKMEETGPTYDDSYVYLQGRTFGFQSS